MFWQKFLRLFFNTYFGPYRTDLGPVLARFRLNWTESENKKNKNHRHACSCVHGHTMHLCVLDSGVPTQSAHPCFPGNKLGQLGLGLSVSGLGLSRAMCLFDLHMFWTCVQESQSTTMRNEICLMEIVSKTSLHQIQNFLFVFFKSQSTTLWVKVFLFLFFWFVSSICAFIYTHIRTVVFVFIVLFTKSLIIIICHVLYLVQLSVFFCLIDKISNGWIRDLGFNPCLH